MKKILTNSQKLSLIFSKCIDVGGCLEWQGGYRKNKNKPTYPAIYHDKKLWTGNRLVLFLKSNEIPEGMFALHKCDNMKCLNLDHLYWGTKAQNVEDMTSRNRHGNQKVTHCPKGHEYSGENLKIGTYGYRYCRACIKMHNKLAWRVGKRKPNI